MSKKLLDLDGLRYFYGKILSRMGNLSNPNLLINGDFQIWQRGTSFTSFIDNTMIYTADRWYAAQAIGTTISVIKDSDNSLKFSQTGLGSSHIAQFIEGDFSNLAGKKLTMSVCSKGNVDTIMAILDNGTGVGSNLVPASTEYKITTLTVILPNSITKDRLRYLLNFANNQGTINIKWIKLELGEIATPLSPRSYAEELALCKRYFRTVYKRSTTTAIFSNQIYFPLDDITQMRVTPTLKNAIELTDFIVYTVSNGLNQTGFNLSLGDRCLIATKNAHGLTNAGMIFGNIQLDAEIY